tara:strand:+ start:53 stop:1021 length:969 start_codon:yes stop_codon:yes gene_type:complete
LTQNQIINGIKAGDTLALAKGITLVESQKPEHRKQAFEIVSALYDHRKDSIRLGITGIPGVGKSTFIESLGTHITKQGLRLAVLAIDPSSSRTAGSILGDKTRMEELSRNEMAFIRPSPSSGTLGGVSARTRESMLLCEAAGYDVILIETVGVGQSETEVINITDTFIMLGMPGTGDELQGIKRGIMETADLIVINKADGDNVTPAKRAKSQIEMALHLFPAAESDWGPKVMLASGLHGNGVKECWNNLVDRQSTINNNGWLLQNRKRQQSRAFQRLAELSIYEQMMHQLNHQKELSLIQAELQSGEINEFEATLSLLQLIS